MTERVYLEDAYLREITTTVSEITPEGGIVPTRSIFHPKGGGQPGDSGKIASEYGTIGIATSLTNKSGRQVLVPSEPRALPEPGDMITMTLDWERRYRHMRLHTALHLLSALLPYAIVDSLIGTRRARLDIRCRRLPTDSTALNRALEQMITRDASVSSSWEPQDVFAHDPRFKTETRTGRPIQTQIMRMIRIGTPPERLDVQPCLGTHVTRTGEIGSAIVGGIELREPDIFRLHVALEELSDEPPHQ